MVIARQLKDFIQVPEDVISQDDEKVRARFGNSAFAEQVMNHRRFGQWINSPSSSFLVVDADKKHSPTDGLSPLSTLGNQIQEWLEKSDYPPIIIKFYCGLHPREDGQDPVPCGIGMLRTVIAQLIKVAPDADMGHGAGFLDEIRQRNVYMLIAAFLKLLLNVPEGTPVVCIIDDVSAFHEDEYFGTSIKTLWRATTLSNYNRPFKLLLTYAKKDHAKKAIKREGALHISLK